MKRSPEQRIYEKLAANGPMTVSQIHYWTRDINTLDRRRVLKRMVEAGLIKVKHVKMGPNSTTVYYEKL